LFFFKFQNSTFIFEIFQNQRIFPKILKKIKTVRKFEISTYFKKRFFFIFNKNTNKSKKTTTLLKNFNNKQ